MIKKSIWENTVSLHENNIINSETHFDILIIGAGIAGMTTAYFLKDSGLKIGIIDKGKIGMGVTSKTTGKLNFLQGCVYQKIKNIHNEETSKKYLDAQIKAINLVKDIVKRNNIDCDLEKVSSFVFANNEKEDISLKKEQELLSKWKIKCNYLKSIPNNYKVYSSIEVKDTYIFNPLKYLYSLYDILKKKMTIIEDLKVDSIELDKNYNKIKTETNTLFAKKVIITTHYPFFIKPGFIPFKSYIEKAYVVASPTNYKNSFTAISSTIPSISMRYYKDYFLLGGMSHKMSLNIDYEKKYEELINFHNKYFQGNINYAWSTHDVMSDDHIPYIGKIDNNLFMATGFNKWGMTNGTLAGYILADLVLDKDNPYQELTNPKRKYNLKRMSKFIVNLTFTSKIFFQTKLVRNPDFYKDNVKVVFKNGKYYGYYKDSNNTIHKVNTKCPHMGCSLIFNNFDKTWDCPCHGSRFTVDGDIIEGPSHHEVKEKN